MDMKVRSAFSQNVVDRKYLLSGGGSVCSVR